MSSEELYNCMNQLKEKHQNQDRTIQMLRKIPSVLPPMQGKKDVKLQIEETSPALLYSGLSDQTTQGTYPTENKKKQSQQLSESQLPPLSLSQSTSKWGKFKNWLVGLFCSSEDTK